MLRTLRSNSTDPPIWPIVNYPIQSEVTMAAPTTTTVWKTNPMFGDFNPGEKVGQSIWIEKTKGFPTGKQFDLSKLNQTEIHGYFKERIGKYGK